MIATATGLAAALQGSLESAAAFGAALTLLYLLDDLHRKAARIDGPMDAEERAFVSRFRRR